MLRKTLKQLPQAQPYLLLTIIGIALFWPTWARLFLEWIKFEQVLAHGLPTFIIFLGLLLFHPPMTPGTSSSPRAVSIAGSVVLITVVATWALLELVRIDTLAYLMVPGGLLALAWVLLGWRPMLSFLPYVLLFGLSLPVWSDLVPFLVILATAVVSELVGGMGITALIEGANITLPYGRLVIADGCSGIRYFAISILLAMMMAILNDFRWKGWLVAVALGAGLALIVNWVRITALVVIAYQTDMESELVADHETFGWAVYAAFLIPVMWLSPVRRRQGDVSGEAVPFVRKGFILLVTAFMIGPVGISLAYSRSGESPPWSLRLSGAAVASPSALPLPLNIPASLHQTVWHSGGEVWVSVAQFQKDRPDQKLVPYLPRRTGEGGWFQASSQTKAYGEDIRIYQNLRNQQQVVSAEYFKVGKYTTSSYAKAKLLQVPAVLAGESRFALINVQSACAPRSCETAARRVRTAMNELTLTPED